MLFQKLHAAQKGKRSVYEAAQSDCGMVRTVREQASGQEDTCLPQMSAMPRSVEASENFRSAYSPLSEMRQPV